MKLFKLSILAAALVGTLVACNKNDAFLGDSLPLTATDAANAASNSTGQGINVDLGIDGNFIVNESVIYHFDQAAAAGYFTTTVTNNMDTAPVQTTTASTLCNGNKCITYSENGPGIDPVKQNVIEQSKCFFFTGSSARVVDTYQKSKIVVTNQVTTTQQVKQGNKTVTVTTTTTSYKDVTWTYTVTMRAVEPETAWTKEVNTGADPIVTVSPKLAGLSVLSSSVHPSKASFSLLNGDGTSRVENLVLNIDGVDYPLSVSVSTGQNFLYTTNSGSNGNTSLLAPYENKFAFDILTSDSHDGNNDPVNAEQAVASTTAVPLGVGEHTITLTGLVKGNAAVANQPISVTKKITISAEGCQN